MDNCSVMRVSPGFWVGGINTPEIDDTASKASSVFVATARMSNAVSTTLKKLALSRNLNILDKKLSAMLDGMYAAAQKAEANPHPAKTTSTKEQYESTIKTLEYLYDVLTRLHSKAHQMGLTNHSLMAASLRSIHRRTEELLDVADWFYVAINSSGSRLDEIYANARTELAEGKVYDLG
jgi:hypothetical protein